MNGAQANTQGIEKTHEVQKTMRFVIGGSLAEGLAGGAAVALSIIALARVYPEILVPIAAIAIGTAFVMEGGTIAARLTDLLEQTGTTRAEGSDVGVGLTAELIGGITGIVLGILALLNLAPLTLLAITAIVYGATLISSSGVVTRLNNLLLDCSDAHELAREVTRQAVTAATGVQNLLGLAAIVLGILGLMNVSTLILTIVAMLCIGVASFVNSAAVTGRMGTFLYRCA